MRTCIYIKNCTHEMLRKKYFWVFEMKPVEDDKSGTSQPAPSGTTTEDDSNEVTPDAAAVTTAEPSPAPGPASEPATAWDATPSFGISMVQGPPITIDLDLPVESSTYSRTPSGRSHISELLSLIGPTATHVPEVVATGTPTQSYTGTSVHFRSDAHRNNHDSSRNQSVYSGSIPSIHTLDREVEHYIKTRESSVYDYYPGTESMDYDYVSERNDLYTTNVVESTAHLIKGSLGGAVLSMHEAYMIGGLWTSLVVNVAIGLLTAHTMIMLITSAQKLYRRLRINKLSYPDLAEAAAATAPWNWVRKKSKIFRYTVEIILVLEMVGTCCIYQIIIAKSMEKMVIGVNPDIYTWLYDIRMYIVISAPMLLPLCLIKRLKWLSPLTLAADVFVAICVITTIYYSVKASEPRNILDRAAWKSLHGFIRIWGICMYGTSGICIALPVENNMKSPKYFPIVVRYATVIVTLLSVITGFFGYWAWGESSTSPVTVHMPRNIGTTVLQFLLVVMLSITFALTMWVPFRIVWHYIIRHHKRRFSFWETLYRFIMTMLVTALSLIAPHTIPIMIFMGHFFLGFIALIFPAFIEFFVNWEEHYASRSRVKFANNAKNFGLIILGLTVSLSTACLIC